MKFKIILPAILIATIGFILLSILFTSFGFISNLRYKNFKTRRNFPQNYKIISPPIPKRLSFCGEKVPLYNWNVKERLDRELIVNTYFHSSTILYLKRARRWFPVITSILKRYGIPDDFKYMAVVESGLKNVVSPKGAVGFWQIMEKVGKKYGLEINKEIDQRYNVEKSTEAASKYLLNAYTKYGNWTLAAASYNLGINGIDKQIKRQKTKNYYNLVLNQETSRFVFRLLAIKQIMQNPEKYGFDLNKKDLYPPLKYYVIKVKSRVKQWTNFAEKHGINYKTLKLYNPWLREDYLKNKRKKSYWIKIPVKGSIILIPNSFR